MTDILVYILVFAIFLVSVQINDDRYLVFYGGGSSGKSYFIGQRWIYKLISPSKCNLLKKQGEYFISLFNDDIEKRIAKCIFIDGLTAWETAQMVGYNTRQIERIRKKLLEVALKMLVEMRTPKKAKNLSGRYWGKAKSGTCPACQSGVNSMENQYCKHCGQALDWSDTE